jgi:hypothetical protein
MKKLSTGDDSTLGNYLKLSNVFFGENSEASLFLKTKINEQSENSEVIQDEGQMIYLLQSLNQNNNI